MKLSLLLILLVYSTVVAQEGQKPDSKVQHGEQQKLKQRDLSMKAAEEQSRLDRIAIEKATQEVSSHPDLAQAHFRLAEALQNGPQGVDTPSKTAREYLKAIELKPDYAEAYYGLAGAYNAMAAYDKVYESLNKAITLKPDYAQAYTFLGLSYLDSDKYINGNKQPVTDNDVNHAVEALEKAVKLKPDYAEAYAGLGMAYSQIGKTTEAVEAFKQSLRFNPDNFQVHYALGMLYIQLGNKEAALQAYQSLKETLVGVGKQFEKAGANPEMAGMVRLIAEELLEKIQQRFGKN